MTNPFEEYEERHGLSSVPVVKTKPVDLDRLNTPAPKAEVPEQCKQCDIGAHCFGGDRNCGCFCTREGRK